MFPCNILYRGNDSLGHFKRRLALWGARMKGISGAFSKLIGMECFNIPAKPAFPGTQIYLPQTRFEYDCQPEGFSEQLRSLASSK